MSKQWIAGFSFLADDSSFPVPEHKLSNCSNSAIWAVVGVFSWPVIQIFLVREKTHYSITHLYKHASLQCVCSFISNIAMFNFWHTHILSFQKHDSPNVFFSVGLKLS